MSHDVELPAIIAVRLDLLNSDLDAGLWPQFRFVLKSGAKVLFRIFECAPVSEQPSYFLGNSNRIARKGMADMKSAQKLTSIVQSLHSEVMQLQSDAGNYNKIVEQIDLLSAVSWDLRRQLQRSRERPKFTSSERSTLPSKIVNLLLEGEYAPLVSSDPSTQAITRGYCLFTYPSGYSQPP